MSKLVVSPSDLEKARVEIEKGDWLALAKILGVASAEQIQAHMEGIAQMPTFGEIKEHLSITML